MIKLLVKLNFQTSSKDIKYEYAVYDLRDNKNRFDDIFLYIKKN